MTAIAKPDALEMLRDLFENSPASVANRLADAIAALEAERRENATTQTMHEARLRAIRSALLDVLSGCDSFASIREALALLDGGAV